MIPSSRHQALSVVALFAAVAEVHATALTAMLAASERSCYYADVDGVGEKVGKSL